MANTINLIKLNYDGDTGAELALRYYVRGAPSESNVVGGDLLSEIQELSQEAEDIVAPQDIEYQPLKWPPKRLTVFAEDSIFDLRCKISIAFGIPLYRVAFFNNEFLPYRLQNVESVTIRMNPSDLFEHQDNGSPMIFDCRIDDALVKLEAHTIVRSHEYFTFVGNNMNVLGQLFVVDLADWIVPNWDKIRASNRHQREYWYWGFVHKFWPLVTPEMLDFILSGNERRIMDDFTDFKSYRETLFKQTEQVTELHRDANTKLAHEIFDSFKFSVLQAIVSINVYQAKINYIDMFNSIHTSNFIPSICLIDEQNGRIYIKNFIRASVFDSTTHAPFPREFRSGIVIAIWVDLSADLSVANARQWIFLNITNRKLQVYMKLREDYSVTYDKFYSLVNKYINPILRRINEKHGLYMHKEFNLFNRNIAKFEYLTIVLIWHRSIEDAQFKKFRADLTSMTGIGLVDFNRFSNLMGPDVIVMDFPKGGTGRDFDLITTRMARDGLNYYAWLWDPKMRNMWMTLYHGFVFKITHRSDNISIEISNTSIHAFELFKYYMSGMFSHLAERKVKELKKYTRKIAKLNQSDPVLFKFANRNASNYSVICQEKKQPVIYNEGDLPYLSDTMRRKLVDYWNFTYNRPSYYACPDPKFPHLGFQIGKHPDGYCLPCCQKLDPSSKPEYTQCKTRETVTKNARGMKHIIAYRDVALSIGRVSEVPALGRILKSNVYVVGVNQHYRNLNHIGLFEAILWLIEETAESFLARIKPTVLDLGLWNDIYNVFWLHQLDYVFYTTYEEFNRVWIDGLYAVYGINVVTVDLNAMKITSRVIRAGEKNILVMQKSEGVFEPMAALTLEGDKIHTTKRYYSDVDLRSLTSQFGTKYYHVPQRVEGRIVMNNNVVGYLYRAAQGGDLLFLPPSFGSPKCEREVASIPFKELPWEAVRRFIRANGIGVVYGIKSEGRVRALIDDRKNIYYFDVAPEDFDERIGDDWHYDINEIYATLYEGHTVDYAEVDAGIKREIAAVSTMEVYRQMIFHYLVYVFVLVLNRFQNRTLREEIFTIVRESKGSLRSLDISNADIHVLLRLYNRYYNDIMKGNFARFTNDVNNEHFEFDEAYLTYLRELPRDELMAKIRDLLAPYVELVQRIERIPHVYHNLQFYEQNKLPIIDAKIFDYLLDAFLNPYLYNYFTLDAFDMFFKNMAKNIDISKFVIVPGEKLEVESYYEDSSV